MDAEGGGASRWEAGEENSVFHPILPFFLKGWTSILLWTCTGDNTARWRVEVWRLARDVIFTLFFKWRSREDVGGRRVLLKRSSSIIY